MCERVGMTERERDAENCTPLFNMFQACSIWKCEIEHIHWAVLDSWQPAQAASTGNTQIANR